MKNRRPLCASLLIICLLLIAGCIGRGRFVPLDKKNLKGSGKIYFVPLGDFPSTKADELAEFYRSKYGIPIETLPGVPLNPSSIDANRQQLIAEAAVSLMKRANPNLVSDAEAILIGLTHEDMYIAQYDWRYTFSWRQEGKYAVVSDARMGLESAGVPAGKLRSRLRKMVTKNVGILYYHLPQSDDPRSVLYGNVGGISELDYMGEEF